MDRKVPDTLHQQASSHHIIITTQFEPHSDTWADTQKKPAGFFWANPPKNATKNTPNPKYEVNSIQLQTLSILL